MNRKEHIAHLKSIVDGCLKQIAELESTKDCVSFDKETNTFSLNGLKVVKLNGKSVLLEDTTGSQYLLRATEKIKGKAMGKRIPIVAA